MHESTTIVELFERRVALSGDAPAIRFRCEEHWDSLSWRDWRAASRRIAAGFALLGVEPHDRIGILSRTQPEWLLCDVAIQMAAATTVPLYSTATSEECAEVLARSQCRLLLVEDAAQLAKVVPLRDRLPDLAKVVVMRPQDMCARKAGDAYRVQTSEDLLRTVEELTADWAVSLDELILVGEDGLGRSAGDVLDMRAAALRPDDPSTLCFAAGDDGRRGVLLSHRNFLWTLRALAQVLPLDESDAQLLALPLPHARGLAAYRLSIATGALCALAQGPQTLLESLHSVRPTFLFCVPQVCEKAHSRLLAEARGRGGIEQAMYQWAFGVGREQLEQRRSGGGGGRLLSLKHKAADHLVFRRVREFFGGRMRFLVVGGAPMRRNVSDFFMSAGIPALESYGLTDVTAISHVNRTNHFRQGTAGTPLPGVQVAIAEDGEILLYGPSVRLGCEGERCSRERPVDEDGWLHTGDFGHVDVDGFLTITGHRGEMIVLANGARVAPAPIERQIELEPLVSHVLVHGDGRHFLSALLTLDEERAQQFAFEREIAYSTFRELTQHPEVYALLDQAIREQNAKLPPHEQVRKFAILDHDFGPETGELSPTMKLRRAHVEDKHQALLASFYRETF